MPKKLSLRYYFLAVIILLFISHVIASDFQTLDLSSVFNNDGISCDTHRNDGDFDGIGEYSPGTFNYAAEELPESNSTITTFDIPFLFPDKTDEKKNNILCQGQTISVTTGNYTGIYILGSSVNGSYEEPVLLYYSDQSIETVKLALSDWCVKPQYGELPAITASFRQMKTGKRAPDENHIWLQALYVDVTKELTAIQLPLSQSLHIFALTLGSGERIDLSKIAIPEKTKENKKKFSLEIQSMRDINLYFTGETAQFKVMVTSIPDPIQKMYFQWQLLDVNNKIVSDNRETLTRWQNGGFIHSLHINGNKQGWYQLQISLRDEENTLLIQKTKIAWVTSVPSGGTDESSKIGIGLGFSGLIDNEAESAGRLVEVASIKWIRNEFSWGKIEPQPGKWNWKDYDRDIELSQKYHVSELGLLDYWTGWSKPYTEDGYKQYANFVYEVVNRYKDKVKYWEIWNEPNIFYWKGTPEQYTELLKLAYQSAKKADPDCKIIGCVTAGTDLKFIERVFKAGGLNYLDGVSIHPYRGPYPDQNGLMDEIQSLHDLINQYQKDSTATKKEVWITEIGWWTNPSNSAEGVTYPVQASCLIRTYILALASDMLNRVFPYTFHDPGNRPDYNEDNFGIVDSHYNPKPSYVAIANLTRQLNGFSFVSSIFLGDDCMAYMFQKEKHKTIVAWHKSGSAAIGIESDANQLTVTDLYGNPVTLIPVEKAIGVTISDMPIYISGDFTQLTRVSKFIDLKLPQYGVKQGQSAEIKIGLMNVFDKDLIGNVALQISDTLQKNLNPDQLEKPVTVKPGEAQEVSFKLNISEDASVGFTPLEIRMNTQDGGKVLLQTQLIIGKNTNTSDEQKKDQNNE